MRDSLSSARKLWGVSVDRRNFRLLLRVVRGLFVGSCLMANPVLADAVAREAATGVMADFLAAFNARDEAAWADTLVYPHVRLASSEVVIYETRNDFMEAMDLASFAAATGWRYSTWDDMVVLQDSATKVHIQVRFSRFDADDALIATYDSLYVIVRIDGRWGVRARSSFAP